MIACLGLNVSKPGITKHKKMNKTTATTFATRGYSFSRGTAVIRPAPMKSTKPHRKYPTNNANR